MVDPTVSDTPDALQQSPNAPSSEPAVQWPPELEIVVEYCTRRPFHARYDPDKYMEYFQAVHDTFSARSAQTKIVGNPWQGRDRFFRPHDKYGLGSDPVELPRLGAFEVTVNSAATGHVTIFSKLECRHWPNPRVLVVQVDRLLRGEALLQPTPRPFDRSTSPKKRTPQPSPRKPQTESSSSWRAKSSGSTASTPRSAASPRSPDRPVAAPKATSLPAAGTSDSREASRPVYNVPQVATAAAPAAPAPPAATDSKGRTFSKQSANEPYEFEEAQDDFEGDESGEGSLVGTKVWMPGAAKEEQWEDDVEASSRIVAAHDTDAQAPAPQISNNADDEVEEDLPL